MIKILISDVDGTLLYRAVNQKPLPHIAEKLVELSHSGIEFMLASGRYDDDLCALEKELPIKTVGYRIGMNGATIVQGNDKIIRNLSLSAVDVENVLHFFHKRRKEGKYVQSTQENAQEIFEAFGQVAPYKSGAFLVSCTNKDGEIYKYFMSDGDMHSVEWNDTITSYFPQFGIYQSSPFTSEISPKDANKGNAIITFAQHYGVELDEIAFIGDSGNDVSAFHVVGKSYCMSHAAQHIQKHAHKIVSDVGEAIQDIIEMNMKKEEYNE